MYTSSMSSLPHPVSSRSLGISYLTPLFLNILTNGSNKIHLPRQQNLGRWDALSYTQVYHMLGKKQGGIPNKDPEPTKADPG